MTPYQADNYSVYNGDWSATCLATRRTQRVENPIMDTNTILVVIVVIFLFGGFGWYGRGRWF